jgi:uncharacterized protein (DUF433 family)
VHERKTAESSDLDTNSPEVEGEGELVVRSVGVRVEELLEKEAEFERVEEKGEGEPVMRSVGVRVEELL